jgi:predicted acyl esterase
MSYFLDNLIPLRKRLNGPQYAGWEPTRLAESGLGCRLYADEKIPMRDGVKLSADVYRPKKAERIPAIVQFAGYSRELHTAGFPSGTNEIGCPPVFTERGYAQVVICRRGMGRSEGERQIIACEADVEDHCECIEWAAAQPWCDGNVALFGTSYYGITQLQAAVRRPPSLRAFFAHEICTDFFRHILRFGGTCNVNFLGLWQAANFTDGMVRLRIPPVARALLGWIINHEWLWKYVVHDRIDVIMQAFLKRTPAWREREWFANWLSCNTRKDMALGLGPSRELKNIEIPFVVVQNLGYLNLHQFGTYDLFEHASTPAGRKWMILEQPHYELPVYAWQLEALAFFDHIIKGVENGYREQAPVRYWVEGKNRYAGAGTFPIPSARRTRLYPAPGASAFEPQPLVSQPGHGAVSWTAVPSNTPLVGGIDEVMNQKLAFDYVAEKDMTLAGPVTVSLRFSCNEIDSYLVARVGRVDADGSYHLLSIGAMSPTRRKEDPFLGSACEIAHDLEHPEPLVPGEPVALRFSLTPSATRLKAGDRLRLEIASRTDLLKGCNRDGYVHFNLAVPPYFSHNTLHLGPETYVEVNVVS